MRIGILGGTFNPIHIGHLILAEEARQILRLDKVVFVPCYSPPHKSSKGLIEARHRLQMVKMTTAPHPSFEVSDIEIKAGGKSYTHETIQKLKEVFPGGRLFLIVGSDAIEELPNWKNFKKILELARIIIAQRPEFPVDSKPVWARIIRIPRVAISSSDIRQRIKKGSSIRYLVPEAVERYIQKNKLYK